MEGEIHNFINVWITVLISLCYCYATGKLISKGVQRLLFMIPVICLFLHLPLNLSSPHLSGTTGFFVAWLANFKLLLFAFGKGPLSSHPSISLPLFLAVSCLPIKIQKDPSPKSRQNGHSPHKPSNPSPNCQFEENPSPKKFKDSFLNYVLKGALVAVMVRVYDYSHRIHPNVILLLYALHVYFLLEINLAITAALVRAIFAIELEPQFDEPYLSTSLQDFWSRRWNLMVTSILRPTVYEPTRYIFSHVIGRNWAALPAVFGTFVASALMHELMFYYLGRVRPTGDISAFFLLHGFCLTAEIALKKWLNGRWRLPRLISGTLTVGFVMATGFGLFFPKFVQCKIDVRAFEDYAAVSAFLETATGSLRRFWRGH